MRKSTGHDGFDRPKGPLHSKMDTANVLKPLTDRIPVEKPKRENAALKAEQDTGRITRQQNERDTLREDLNSDEFTAQLAFAFRQRICSCIVDCPPANVSFMPLQLLEMYVHDSTIYKDTPVEKRWIKVCDYFKWKRDWDTDEEIPLAVKYVDRRAEDAPRHLYYLNAANVVEAPEEPMQQLPEDDGARDLLKLWDTLKTFVQEDPSCD